jgi:carbamoyl-phosphate synthase large subunit
MGGSGGGIAYDAPEYESILSKGLHESPTSEVLVEQSVLGWKEFELEVMRDRRGTFVVVCSIENLDPMGVHTGDSITIAPQMTLTDPEYQAMRDEAKKVIENALRNPPASSDLYQNLKNTLDAINKSLAGVQESDLIPSSL